MKKYYLFLIVCLFSVQSVFSQSYFDGKFKQINESKGGDTYTLYDFSREGTVMKAKYFATNAYEQYEAWKSGKEILLITAGAFSDAWDSDAKPVGLCVDNGTTITKTANQTMDGMVIVYNGAAQAGGIAIVDLDAKPIKCETTYGSGNYEYYRPRSSSSDKTNFLDWGSREGLTLFQTQLVYSKDKTTNFSNLTYGDKRERRFLAICYKYGVVHHVVINAPSKEYLNVAAQNTKEILEENDFSILYILNLDTGAKNLLYAYNGNYLKDLKPENHEYAKIENATNLLIYYKD